MNKIKLLDKNISDLIAAGEVVERPASVVKELIENSIDAGASKIIVEIKNSGSELIKITDNGAGMSPEDAKNAFLKHATSKISSKDDLYSIHTLGFRGEALPSIAAVSKILLKTKEKDSLSGWYIKNEGGEILEEGETGLQDGTVFEIRDLFFNTPARLKFLKSESTETTYIQSLVEKLALSNPLVSFTFISNGNQRLFTSGNADLKQTVFAVFGRDLTEGLIPVNYTQNSLKITGFTGKPLCCRANRNSMIYFVNGRYIKSKLLQQATESAYRNSMLAGKYPCCILFIEIPYENVDINVHPSKTEIKFSDERTVAEALLNAVKTALLTDSGIREVNIIPEEKVSENTPFVNEKSIPVADIIPDKQVHIEENTVMNDWTIRSFVKSESKNDQTYDPLQGISDSISELRNDPFEALRTVSNYIISNETNVVEAKETESIQISGTEAFPKYRIIGEAFDSYIIVQLKEELLFLDKHALHERILFENLRKKQTVQGQLLLTPLPCLIGPDESSVLLDNQEILHSIGFDIDDFGASIIIREIPSIINVESVETLLNEIAGLLKVKNASSQEMFDTILHTVACKAAIKSGYKTPEEEDEYLVSQYFTSDGNLKYCPHGRPLAFTLTSKNIEKQFKRIV